MVVDTVCLADKPQVASLTFWETTCHFIDIVFAKGRHLYLRDIADLEVGMQRSSRLIVAVRFQLDLTFHAQLEAGNQRKSGRPPLIGLFIVFQREGQNNAVLVLIVARHAQGLGANGCATAPNQGQQIGTPPWSAWPVLKGVLALSQIIGLVPLGCQA